MTKQDLINRLHRVKGQISGIEKMIESEATCADVTLQIKAVSRAISKIGEHVVYNNLEQCMSLPSLSEANSKVKLLLKDIFSIKNN